MALLPIHPQHPREPRAVRLNRVRIGLRRGKVAFPVWLPLPRGALDLAVEEAVVDFVQQAREIAGFLQQRATRQRSGRRRGFQEGPRRRLCGDKAGERGEVGEAGE